MANHSQRIAFDEAIANMSVQASPYFKEYVFYLHLLSKCTVIFTENLPAIAGVTFKKSNHILFINPSEVIATVEKEDGTIEEVLGFSSRLPLEQRIGVLKHEMLHVCLGHLVYRIEDRNALKFNYTADCALNQDINRDHLPEYAIYPDNLPVRPDVKTVPVNETAEFYYELLPDPEENENGGGGSSFESGGNSKTVSGKTPGRCVDDHDLWKEIEGDLELQKEITKNIVENAGNNTIKSKGTLPTSYSTMIENLTINREVNWKKLLKTIIGNKKANKRKTLLRRNRRLPFAHWLKGVTKDRIFELVVISDVSGSVSDKALLNLWGTIVDLCSTFDVKVNVIQVDTEPTEPELLDKNTTVIERKKIGGTMLFGAMEKIKEHRIRCDAIVVTTDGHLFGDDVEQFEGLRIPLIWLIEPHGQIMKSMDNGRMTAVQLSKEELE